MTSFAFDLMCRGFLPAGSGFEPEDGGANALAALVKRLAIEALGNLDVSAYVDRSIPHARRVTELDLPISRVTG